jgi:hypothetical protein
MSSHREAPEIAKDPVADSADVYAFVSPDRPDTVTLIATYVPLQGPAGGPNFFEFGDDVLYEIHIDNNGDGKADVRYEIRFTAKNAVGGTFLYNTGPILRLDSPNWNRRQTYSVARWTPDDYKVLGTDLPCPPCNIGPLSTPNYTGLSNAAIRTIGGTTKVFAGQVADGFYVDLGSVFDLADLRPFQQLHAKYNLTLPGFDKPAKGVNALANVNVHAIALQVPIRDLLAKGAKGTDVNSPSSVIGVWTTASRQAAHTRQDNRSSHTEGVQSKTTVKGPFLQVSRLANPLVNEVLIPIENKDYWNRQPPHLDRQFRNRLLNPELARLLPALYPGVFPNLQKLNDSGAPRKDILAILHTGLPAGIVGGFQNSGGSTEADLLRLNVAIPPAAAPNNLGVVGGDLAGFPNGRRVFDDVLTIELRALAGITYPLIDPTFTPDAAAGAISDGTAASPTDLTASGTEMYRPAFPYLGVAHDGYRAVA